MMPSGGAQNACSFIFLKCDMEAQGPMELHRELGACCLAGKIKQKKPGSN